MEIDYSEIISLVATVFRIALPIGVIFGMSEWALGFFFKCAFPWMYRKGD